MIKIDKSFMNNQFDELEAKVDAIEKQIDNVKHFEETREFQILCRELINFSKIIQESYFDDFPYDKINDEAFYNFSGKYDRFNKLKKRIKEIDSYNDEFRGNLNLGRIFPNGHADPDDDED